ncbi:hypothetical protein ACLOJK_036513 [Asimina triloba]
MIHDRCEDGSEKMIIGQMQMGGSPNRRRCDAFDCIVDGVMGAEGGRNYWIEWVEAAKSNGSGSGWGAARGRDAR